MVAGSNNKEQEGALDSILDQINYPCDLNSMSLNELLMLADELRQEVIRIVSVTGGHLGASLGVIELTIALHSVFDAPEDKIIWDVGHQTYPHKIITGRKNRMNTLRKAGGISGFTKRSESIYDPFGAAHASTSVSAALGIAAARDLNKDNFHIVSVIGDGALSGGMAYEAINNAGDMGSRLIVILNDNNMSIDYPVGAMSKYLSSLVEERKQDNSLSFLQDGKVCTPFGDTKEISALEKFTNKIPGKNIFEELGFNYIGPLDGHNLRHLLPVLRNVKSLYKGPVLIHCVTNKGKGYIPAENSYDKYHGVVAFDIETGKQKGGSASVYPPNYTNVFASALVREASKDENIIAITAAMPSGTGLNLFKQKFPERFFDVGIAEQHAVTFAAGLACQGMKPFCAIYSTFLQRAYDQVIHDVALQSLPVRFALDRAGFVGEDGPTHSGSFDIAYLCAIPGFVVMAASDENELNRMVATAALIDDGPCAFRYPRGKGQGVQINSNNNPLDIGLGNVIYEGSDIAFLCFGARLKEVFKASKFLLEVHNLSCTVADARFAKPLDKKLIKSLAKNHKVLITIEEGVLGGFGSHVVHFLAEEGLLDGSLKVRSMVFPDCFIDQNSMSGMYKDAGMNSTSIAKKVLDILGVSNTNFIHDIMSQCFET